MRKTNQDFQTNPTDHKRNHIGDKEKKRMLAVANLTCVALFLVLVLALASFSFSAQSVTAKNERDHIITVAKSHIVTKAHIPDKAA